MHADSDSGIWEAVSLDCERAHGLSQREEGAATCLYRWLSARAPGLRQLAFCDSCSRLGSHKAEEVGDATLQCSIG